jgi:hypothetical protein
VEWETIFPKETAPTAQAVSAMHANLRDCCNIMGVGIGAKDKPEGKLKKGAMSLRCHPAFQPTCRANAYMKP